MIYFVRDESFIKIGYVEGRFSVPSWPKYVRDRIVSLANGNPRPLELLGAFQGSRERERILHSIFRDDHVRGEWFRESSRLISLIKRFAVRVPVPVKKIGNRMIYE